MKYPALMFYTGDWLKDPKLSMCLPATRGIWTDAIASMHENARSGVLSGTPSQLARVLRCTESAFMDAIMDLRSTGAADVTERHGIVTLINRRMFREAKERAANRLRQSKRRGHAGRAPPVTERSRSYSSVSSSNSKEEKKPAAAGVADLPSVESFELAGRLRNAIAARDPGAKAGRETDLTRWARDIDRLLRIDRRSVQDCEAVIDWCQQSAFWAPNILSGAKLREKFDQLFGQMKERNADKRGYRPDTTGLYRPRKPTKAENFVIDEGVPPDPGDPEDDGPPG